ncbi:putative DNA photolyase [Leishmania major strain Friedlin]|uniref:Putative DNA photolyase n=1 Tax=Leishmania major TaxID=5664 RepID=Q4QHY9_LEIMA|nr:putative DNA photolyase [Leishmania major strain Friedlin]CAG9569648.1 DNA_photolyase_-__putative [Leishmania major strain Friedlin]CAJ02458.1 putative DNA photolyase [Leishmania major strain Friedlin]|eukprot:XP_001681209.1 putative DNA photolyase [Leishmania major strain Friedlin]
MRQVETDSEFLAPAQGLTPPLSDSSVGEVNQAAATAEDGSHGGGVLASKISWGSPAPPLALPEDAAELATDLAQEVSALYTDSGVTSARCWEQAEQEMEADSGRRDDDGGVEFGDDAERDEQLLASLKGRHVQLQNTPDVVMAPLIIPDRNGRVAADTQPLLHCRGGESEASASEVAPRITARLLHRHSHLAEQDRMYLGPCTAPEAQLRPPDAMRAAPPSAGTQRHGCCVLVVFSSTDLRVHDNQLLAFASVCTKAAAEEVGGPVPVIGVCVLDYRTFAQPSAVGGFFRQSPQRAQFLLDTVAALRRKLEDTLHVPLLVRCGRPEEHVPRLAVELGATVVLMTTQYAPHERRVQALMVRRLRAGTWVSREEVSDEAVVTGAVGQGAPVTPLDKHCGSAAEEDDPLIAVVEHASCGVGGQHPYHCGSNLPSHCRSAAAPPVVHSVWQSTLVHLDDLPTPLAVMKEGERWYHDDVTVSAIRPTEPYDKATALLAELPLTWQAAALLPTEDERYGRAGPSVLRGALPRLEDLGYSAAAARRTDFAFQEVIATQSSHPDAGEDAALARLQDWLAQGGVTSLLRYGRERRTNTKMYSQKLARVSPYIALGALSPRKYYEVLREFAQANQRDAFVQQQFREGLLRLSRRDYWHWMGLRFGDRLFFSYGPHPEHTDDVPEWRHDRKVVQRWCDGLTGIPFADAAMRELVGTGFVAQEGRQALAWLLTRGYGQDWRLGAEWMERCSLDYDPFVCYGNYAHSCGLMLDDFGEPVRNVYYLAHQHDQTGIYVKKWLPQLSKVPPVYIHRPHVLTERMQAMHGVYLGKNYPYPLKLWQGAQRSLSAAELTAYYPQGIVKGPGYAEALRYGSAVMQPEEYNAAVSPAYLQRQEWATMLPASAFAGIEDSDDMAKHFALFEAAAPRKPAPPAAVVAAESTSNRVIA